MNTELIITLIKFLNIIFCLFLFALIIWHNAKQKLYSNTIIALSFLLIIFLLVQLIYTTNYEIISISISLIIIFILLLSLYKLDLANNNFQKTPQTDLINQAKEQERSRIYANLHDDVGAKLLELIYTAKDDNSKTLAKQVLSDIRQAVASTVNVQCNINQLVTEINEESEMRLSSASITFSTNNKINNPNQNLATTVPIVLSRICREVISNIIKHAQATKVRMSINSTDEKLQITIQDNGTGLSEKNKTGKGFKTINKRAQSISSVVKWQSESKTEPNKGTKFTLAYIYGNH
jgi:signal transduction histidine kinase